MGTDLSFLNKYKNRNILIAPLNWGLGHATRCIPIIAHLKEYNRILIASDGLSMTWLSNEFPELTCFGLPEYGIRYAYQKMWVNMLLSGIGIVKAIRKEAEIVDEWVRANNIDLVISDHRLGLGSVNIERIVIAHQLRILHKNPIISYLSTQAHLWYINKFSECWIPDYQSKPGISGELSDINLKIPTRYIGPLSRFESGSNLPVKYNTCIILSGPEPARTKLEDLLLQIFFEINHQRIILVRGSVQPLSSTAKKYTKDLEIVDLADTIMLQKILNQSRLLISRSGYTSLMDLYALNLKAIIIPTPGQPEQEYLARLHGRGKGVISITESELNTVSLNEALHELSK